MKKPSSAKQRADRVDALLAAVEQMIAQLRYNNLALADMKLERDRWRAHAAGERMLKPPQG